MASIDRPISRRQVIRAAAAIPPVVLAACTPEPLRTLAPTLLPSPTPTHAPTPTAPPTPTPSAAPTPVATAATRPPVLYRDAALADGRSPTLQLHLSVLVAGGRVAWIRPRGDEADSGGAEVVDAAGATIVPGMVDAHSHVTNPGGANWLDRFDDPPERMLAYAEANAKLAWSAGVRWFRDVGSPTRRDPVDGRERALALGIRDRWAGRDGYPTIRAAGTWITRPGSLPAGLTLEARNADELLALAIGQLDAGADLVKLYMDAPGGVKDSPFTVDAVRETVEAVHARGAKVAAHSTYFDGARVAAEAGVDSIEHGMQVSDETARTMKRNKVTLVSTLSVFASWETFARTTAIDRFTKPDGLARTAAMKEGAYDAIAAVKRAGVTIATGSDFGGGSVRAGHLAWEVELLVAAGLEPYEALAAATRNGGALYGVDHAGRIDEGFPADLVLVHGDPLSDARAMWRVWAVFQRGARIA